MSEYTPGPWTAESEPDPDDLGIAIIADGDKNPTRGLVGVATWRTAETEEAGLAEQRANADLFAAAPETAAERDRLREALERLHERCEIDATMEGPVFKTFRRGKLAGRTATDDFRFASAALDGTAPSEAVAPAVKPLVRALDQACLELEEAGKLLDGTRLGGSASLMRIAVNRHRATLKPWRHLIDGEG